MICVNKWSWKIIQLSTVIIREWQLTALGGTLSKVGKSFFFFFFFAQREYFVMHLLQVWAYTGIRINKFLLQRSESSCFAQALCVRTWWAKENMQIYKITIYCQNLYILNLNEQLNFQTCRSIFNDKDKFFLKIYKFSART